VQWKGTSEIEMKTIYLKVPSNQRDIENVPVKKKEDKTLQISFIAQTALIDRLIKHKHMPLFITHIN